MKRNSVLSENTTRLFYELINELLYCKKEYNNLRLYISLALEKKVFKLVYNEIDYLEYIRTYKKLTIDLFIYNIIIKLHEYIRYYSYY